MFYVVVLICFSLVSISLEEDFSVAAATGRIVLATGAEMPSIGIGTWLVQGQDAHKEVEWALDVGYRSIDTAAVYENEHEVGEAIQHAIATGKVKRQEIFVTTKFWPSDIRKKQDVKDRLKRSLENLQLDYVDLYLLHKPERDGGASNLEMWKGLELVYKDGLAKAIGVSTFNSVQLQELIDHAEIKPHNVQNEAHLYRPDSKTFEFCLQNNISYTAYSPLGNPGWKGNAGQPSSPLENESVKRIAKQLNRTTAQVLLRYLLQRGMAVIPKSSRKERIVENFNIGDFQLTEEDMSDLKGTCCIDV